MTRIVKGAARSVSLLVVAVLIGLLALAGPASADDNGDEWAFVRLINQSRAEAGLAPLAVFSPLRDIARAQSIRMGQQSRLYHNPNLAAEVSSAAPDWRRAGENVGQGFDVEGLHRAFMNSPAHREIILGDYNYVGLGVVHANGYTWVTEVFLRANAGKPVLAEAPPPPPVPVDRIAMPDGDTSLAVARRFPSGQSDAVVVGRSDVFADALTGGPLAAVNRGPLLLTAPGGVRPELVVEAQRVLKPGGTAYLLGGTSALSPAVEAAFRDAGLAVERIAGNDRFETAVAVARKVNLLPGQVFVVSGLNFADAMVAGPVAGAMGAPIVLSAPDVLPSATAAYLLTVPAAGRTVIGGPAAVSDNAARQAGATERVAGQDRFDTSTKVAARWMGSASELSFATGLTFQDALTGASLSAQSDAPLLLLAPMPTDATRAYVNGTEAQLRRALLYGGALPDSSVAWAFA